MITETAGRSSRLVTEAVYGLEVKCKPLGAQLEWLPIVIARLDPEEACDARREVCNPDGVRFATPIGTVAGEYANPLRGVVSGAVVEVFPGQLADRVGPDPLDRCVAVPGHEQVR